MHVCHSTSAYRTIRAAGLLMMLSMLNAAAPGQDKTSPETPGETTEVPNDGAKTPTAAPANRLARESSPYLLMHAHNPVDWYPWGPEAFEKARAEGKMIFLSIGYSSCYWCHVMERQTFTNQKVADYLNEHFVSIKVDREERPDVDDIYMTSLIVYQQAAGRPGGGGWPLSMFLTPEGDPIAGATYLPPEDTADGRTGFLTAAQTLLDVWTNRREPATASAAMIASEVRRLSGASILADTAELKPELLTAVADDIASRFDPEHGGVDFNARNPGGPRFPNVPRLLFLLHRVEQVHDEKLSNVVNHSLTAMARGGIRDHLGGGFHRYSTDRKWIVPHFEKMLYDQAQLLEAYSLAAAAQPNTLYSSVIDELVGFLSREMTLPDGGFCSALDAETNAIEGEFYVWTEDEIRSTLSSHDAVLFLQTYGFHEPQSFEHGRVLYVPPTVELPTDPALVTRLRAARESLLAVRSQRERPFLDDKVLTEWNALMIQALATSGRLPERANDLKLATRAAEFLLSSLRDADGHLLRSWRKGVAGPKAYLDDYAALISALIELHQSTGDARWLTTADELQQQQIALFHDADQKAFYFTSRDHEKLFARGCSPYDSVSPSGNGMSVRNLVRLSQLTSNSTYRDLAGSTLSRFSGTLAASPAACAGLGLALQDYLRTASPVTEPRADARHLRSGLQSAVLTIARHGTPVTTVLVQEQQPTDETAEPQQAFKPVLPDPAAPASPFKRNYTERPVKAKIYPMFDKLERGGKCPVAIELTIGEEWHINANPANPDFLIPTEITIKSEQKVTMTKVRYPKHELLKVDGQDEPSHVYGGKVIVYALLEIAAEEAAELAELEVEVKFQACNSRTCEPPDAIKLKGKLPLANPGDEIKRINESRFPKDDPEKGEGETADPKAADDPEKPATPPKKNK